MNTQQSISGQNELSRMQQYRLQLKSISNKLREMANANGRKDVSTNQLLRECYQLTNRKLMTLEEWNSQNYSVKKGQHAYLFWGTPVKSDKGYEYCPLAFLFEENQVQLRAQAAN